MVDIRFFIKFTCKERKKEYPLQVLENIGLKFLNRIKKEFSDIIDEHKTFRVEGEKDFRDIIVYVNEKIAQKTPYFENNLNIEVKVPKGSFNKYSVWECSYMKEGDYNYVYRKFNTKKLLIDWENAGFPIIWHQ